MRRFADFAERYPDRRRRAGAGRDVRDRARERPRHEGAAGRRGDERDRDPVPRARRDRHHRRHLRQRHTVAAPASTSSPACSTTGSTCSTKRSPRRRSRGSPPATIRGPGLCPARLLTSSVASPDPRPRSFLRRFALDVEPLRVSRDFRLIWTGLFISELGYQFTLVAIFVQVYAMTGSAAAVGLTGLVLVPRARCWGA